MKDKLIVYIEFGMVRWLAAEAERRKVSMSHIVREALAADCFTWEPQRENVDDLLTGQSDIFGNVKRDENGA